MKRKEKSTNNKILESKEIIRKEKEKIKREKKNLRKKKKEKFKKTAFGRILYSIFSLFSDEKNSYSFSEVFVITILSILLGAFACFIVLSIIFHGRSYIKYSSDLGKFYDVYETLLENYNGKIEPNELVESAIDGMVSSVGDVYTSYSDTEDTDTFNNMVIGKYEGIGCTIAGVEGGLMVVTVYEETPAYKAGLASGDIIKTVDNIDATQSDTAEISNYIRNEAKGNINIVIERNGEEKKLTVTRGSVEIPVVDSKLFYQNGKTIGYISISLFSSVSVKQFEKHLTQLENSDIDGLIIDVRGNSGGYLSTVTSIASKFVKKGDILYQVQKGDKVEVTKDKTSDSRKYPIAILVNGGSASASEILAAIIKETYSGYVVGTKTYGKGTVQQVKPLSDGSMLKYTTENWLTPSGNWINNVGVEPTHEVKLNPEYYNDMTDESDNQLQEALSLISK